MRVAIPTVQLPRRECGNRDSVIRTTRAVDRELYIQGHTHTPSPPPRKPENPLFGPQEPPGGPRGPPGTPPGPPGLIQTHISTRAHTRILKKHFSYMFQTFVEHFCQKIGPGPNKSTCLMKTKVVPIQIMCRMHRSSGPGDLYLTILWIS